MRTNILIRWGGLAALLCGILGIVGELFFFFAVGNRPYSVVALSAEWLGSLMIMLLSTFLLIPGLIALYARQSLGAGRLGLVSFLLAVLGSLMLFGHQWGAAFVLPVIAQDAPALLDSMVIDTTTVLAGGVLLTSSLMTIGWFLFGLASLRARVLPRASAWVTMLGAILFVLMGLMNIKLDGVVLYLGIAWMGAWLWLERVPKG